MKCVICKEEIKEKGCELDIKGSNEWLCLECYENIKSKC